MPIVVADLVAETVARRKAWIAAVGLSVVPDATNGDVVPWVAFACRNAAVALASPGTVADADLAPVDPTLYDKLADLAELRCLETVLGNWSKVAMAAGQDNQQLQQFADRAAADLERKRTFCRQAYGYGLRQAPVIVGPPPQTPTATTAPPTSPIPPTFPVYGGPTWGIGDGRLDH